MKKRLISYLLSLFIAFSPISIRPAYAILPIVYPLAVAAGDLAAGTASLGSLSSLAGAAGGLGLGLGLGYLYHNRGNGSDGSVLTPPKPTVIPPGDNVSPANKPANWPSPNQPPSAVFPIFIYFHNPNYKFPSAAEAAEYNCSVILGGTSTSFAYNDRDGQNWTCFNIPGNPPRSETFAVKSLTTCPDGYSYDGVACHIYNPDLAKWPKDGAGTTNPNGTPNPRDSDNDNTPSLPGNNTSEGVVLSESGSSPDGSLISHSVIALPSGGRLVVEAIQSPGAETSQVTTIETDKDGKVLNTSISRYPSTTTPQQIVQQVVHTHTGTNTNTGTDSPALPQNIATEGTLSTIKEYVNSINTFLNSFLTNYLTPLKDWLFQAPPSTTPVDAKASDISSNIDKKTDVFNKDKMGDPSGFDFGFAPQIPFSQCSKWSMPSGERNGKSEINPCPAMDMIRDIAGYVFYIATAFWIFAIATRKPS